MKLATFVPTGAQGSRPGVVLDDTVLDLASLVPWAQERGGLPGLETLGSAPASVLELLERGQVYLMALGDLTRQIAGEPTLLRDAQAARAALALSEVRLKAPIERPPAMRDFMAFEEHIKTIRTRQGREVHPVWYEIPVFYFCNPATVLGPDDEVSYPPASRWWDYELEISCVIGRGGSNIPADDAADQHIAGFTILNDWSARDVQFHEMEVNLGPSKGKDFATSLGPWITTLDELEDRQTGDGRYDLAMTARVNGAVYSQGNLKTIYWTFRQMVSHASRDSYVGCGDVLGSGTVGTGCILELGPKNVGGWLKAGDVVELEIDRLGVLRNRVAAPKGQA
ncbi:MAG: fumarylacetoacetate hydrolase family protein [Dehalococcoidia bacterium]